MFVYYNYFKLKCYEIKYKYLYFIIINFFSKYNVGIIWINNIIKCLLGTHLCKYTKLQILFQKYWFIDLIPWMLYVVLFVYNIINVNLHIVGILQYIY